MATLRSFLICNRGYILAAGGARAKPTAGGVGKPPACVRTILQVTGAAFRELQSLTKLTMLHSRRSPISDEGARWITRLPQVKKLDFQGPGISPETFAELTWPASLQSIDLSRSRLTDKGFLRLANCPNLRSVNVEGTQVTAEAVKQLQQARPGVVVRGP